jgi:hypothetical protein
VAKKKKLAAVVKAAPDVFRWKDCLAKYGPTAAAAKTDFDDIAMYSIPAGQRCIERRHADPRQPEQAGSATGRLVSEIHEGHGDHAGRLPYFPSSAFRCP